MTAPNDVLAALVDRIEAHRAGLGAARLICVDGPAGSGKTTLAAQLGSLLPSRVIHMDDLYEGWTGIEAGVTRLQESILAPLAVGMQGRYQRYDWVRGAYAERHTVPLGDFLIVEGCGSAARGVDRYAPFIIWVEADDDARLARGLARDGTDMASHWHRFMLDERDHYRRNETSQRADVHLDGVGEFVR